MASKDFIRQFILTYKHFPCLWDKQHRDYNNKSAREVGYQNLLHLSNRYYTEADQTWVSNKIQNLRTSFNRERKKVLWQRQCGGPEYVSSLWYYEMISFIDKECHSEFANNTSSETFELETGDKSPAARLQEDNSEFAGNSLICAPITGQSKKRKLTQNHDVFDALATTWASKLRKLGPLQKVLAEDLVNNILKKAFFNELTRNTIIMEK